MPYGICPVTQTQSPALPGGPRAAVEFRALGPVQAVIAGRPVDLGAPKQRTLLALLVSQAGQPVTVDVMMEALWAGHPPPSAMTSLQAYVANLRKLLEPDRAPRRPATVLRTCTQGYLLDVDATDVDARRFVEHAKAGWQARGEEDPQRALSESEAALALWRGQAYQEVAAVPCVVPEVARLQELRLSVVEMRCAALLDLGAHEMAAAELEAFMKANPLREYGCELLSLALYRAGRQADALEVLQTMQIRLTEELGVDPRMALQHLRRKILNQAPSLDRRPTPIPARPVPAGSVGSAAPPRAGVAGPPPAPDADREVFVGREAALRQLTEALASAQAGRGRVVTVSGEPGAGKTSLLRRFAEPTGVPVLWGTCTEHVTAPSLWVWEQVLRAAATAFPHHPVPRQVSELLDGDSQRTADGTEPPGAALRRFEAIVQYLTGLSRTGPLVVMLDQLHRADPGSLRLLAHLAESVPASRLLLVVSYRSHEAPVLAETLAALARGEMTRLELGGLTPQDTQALASAILRREVSSLTAKGLCARTDGNPFFLREMIGLLTDDQRLDDPHAAPVPVLVREVVLGRIARLPRPVVEVLSVAAVVGRHFDIAVVAGGVPVGIDAALAALDTAITAGLIVEDQRRLGWFRFTHALVAEVLYETTGRLRRARLHRWIGAAADRAGTTDRAAERAARTARHMLPVPEGDPAAETRASMSIGG